MTTRRINGETVELIEVHQIDFDYCGNTFGVLPCTAVAETRPEGEIIDGELVCPPLLRQVAEFNANNAPFIRFEKWSMSADYTIKFRYKKTNATNVAAIVINQVYESTNSTAAAMLIVQISQGKMIAGEVFRPSTWATSTVDITQAVEFFITINRVSGTYNLIIEDYTGVVSNTSGGAAGAGNEAINSVIDIGRLGPIYNNALVWDFKVTQSSVIIRDLPLNGSAEDLTGNTTPVATNVTWPEVEADGREPVTRQVGQFNASSIITMTPILFAGSFSIQFKITVDADAQDFYFYEDSRGLVYIQFSGSWNQTGAGRIKFYCNGKSIGGGATAVNLQAGIEYQIRIDYNHTTQRAEIFSNNDSLYGDANFLGSLPYGSVGPATLGARLAGGGGTLGHFFGHARDFKIITSSGIIRDLPLNGTAEDLTGNTAPVATNVTWPEIVESYICALQPDPDKKCYHTFTTCQDTQNFDKTTKTLTLSKPQSATLKEQRDIGGGQFVDSTVYTIPVLKNENPSNTSPTVVNIGARSNTAGPLGNFGRLSVSYQDIPHNDNVVDPYASERSWNALERGTFWTKFLARNKYYNARAYRVYTGFAGQYLEDFEVKHYEIDTISRPNSSGNLTLVGLSPFRKLDERKVQYPTQSNSKLLTNLSVGNTAGFEVDIDVNLAEDYEDPFNKLIFINGEIIKYDLKATHVGVKVTYSGLTRGMYNTEETDHSIDDSAQHVIFFDRNNSASSLYNILETLFLKAGFDASILDLANWQTEINDWLLTYSRLERVIFEPTSIKELIGELSRECGFFTWFEETENLVKLKAIRPEIGELVRLSEDNNLIGGKTEPDSKTDSRTSQVVVDSNLISATADATKRINYKNTNIRFSDTASPLKYGEESIFSIKARWLYSQTQIQSLTSRALRRYEDDAQFINFSLDIKDDLVVGQVFELTTSRYVDADGLQEVRQWQVLSRHRKGDTITIQAQEFYITGNYFVLAPDGLPNYDNATDEQKETYGYLAPLSDGKEYILF